MVAQMLMLGVGWVSRKDAFYNVFTGNGELSDYVGIATFGYGKGMTAAMQKSGLDTKGMEVFNSIKTDVMGCITGGARSQLPTKVVELNNITTALASHKY